MVKTFEDLVSNVRNLKKIKGNAKMVILKNPEAVHPRIKRDLLINYGWLVDQTPRETVAF